MYQFYYAEKENAVIRQQCIENVRNEFEITAIRPTMWEEHCLECSAPVCFENCVHYKERSDGRCKRFENGLSVFDDKKACCSQGVHVKFRKWGNMMTVLFPAMLAETEYEKMFSDNEKMGRILKAIAFSKLPQNIRWQSIRTLEYIRRRKLRSIQGENNQPDAFIFHGFSYYKESYSLILEVYDDHTPVFKFALSIKPGENLVVLPKSTLSPECAKAGNLVKIYPENDLEAELDILWCDFVQGKSVIGEQPSSTVKCVVWDLDNTVWDGTLIEEENPDHLKIKPGILEVMKKLDERGILQSIASKNDFETAWKVAERLGISEYFLYPQIHWNAKSGSMKEIANKLNIGIDSLALVDDTVFEREQVKSIHSQVRCYDVTEAEKLLDYPEFQVMVTEESKKRRAMYRAEEKRTALQKSDNSDTVAFLKKCHLQISIFEPQTDEEKSRCYELVVRTNQLNMSGKKYTWEEFEKVLNRKNCRNFAFSCIDDFGEYGIVGFGQYSIEEDRLVFSEFAMSCRVAGKYVESALFTNLLNREECKEGSFCIHKTKKNILLRKTLEEIGFCTIIENDKDVEYIFTGELKNKELVSCL